MKALLLSICLLGVALPQAQSQTAAKGDLNPKNMPYNERTIARGFGNIGRWWSLMSDSDKAAFLDGYQMAMDQAHQHEQNVCEVMRQDISKDPNIPIKAMSEILFMGSEVSDTADYDKVTVKDVDEFYAELLNQEIPVQLSMEWLRDKTRGSKTRGQLIDTLDKYQQTFKISQKD
ncbi:MAG: hypothetical protein ACYCRE_05800 [Acidobacteriaceae bacterium]